MRGQHTVQRGKGPLRETSFAVEGRLHAKRADDGQQESQRRPALAAIKLAAPLGDFFDRRDKKARLRFLDRRAKRAEALCRGRNVGGDAVADDFRLFFTERRADEKPVRLRFGGRDTYAPRARAGRNRSLHRIPPSRIQSRSASTGIVSTRTPPIFSGTMRCILPPEIFLSTSSAS